MTFVTFEFDDKEGKWKEPEKFVVPIYKWKIHAKAESYSLKKFALKAYKKNETDEAWIKENVITGNLITDIQKDPCKMSEFLVGPLNNKHNAQKETFYNCFEMTNS